MSTNVSITATLANGVVTLSPEMQPVIAQLGDTVDVTWTADGGTFESTGAGMWLSGSGSAPTLSNDGATMTASVPVPEGGVPLTFWYTVTLVGGATATGCIYVPTVWAYPDSWSLFPGDELKLHVSKPPDVETVGIRFYSITAAGVNASELPQWATPPLMATQWPKVSFGTALPQPNNASGSGTEDWQWPQNVTIGIPSTWETGIYIAEIGAYSGASPTEESTPYSTTWMMFVVKNPDPVPNTILYKWNINTIQAYSLGVYDVVYSASGIPSYCNDLYANPSSPPGLPPSATEWQVTLRRPGSSLTWGLKATMYDYPCVLWLQKQGYKVDYCTDIEIELDTDLTMLANYPVVLFRGHDEYMGAQSHVNLTNYRNAGGNIAFLAGNTCCWRVRYGEWDPVLKIPTSFRCNKGPNPEDVNGPDAWWVIGQLDNQLVGAGSRNVAITADVQGPFAGYPQGQSGGYVIPPSPGYQVQNTSYWIFDNSGLSDGDVIGYGNPGYNQTSAGETIVENLIGYEANGARLVDSGSGTLAYTDGTPANFVLLGIGQTTPYTPAVSKGMGWWAFTREGDVPGSPTGIFAATMGCYSSYGMVFTGSTIHWVMILDEWDYAGGFFLSGQNSENVPIEYWALPPSSPSNWGSTPPQTDAQGNPILGNQYLHSITRNVLDAFLNPARSVAAVGDLDGDGQADVLLQSVSTGEPSYWLMNGTARIGSGSILYPNGSGAPGSLLRLAGIATLTAPNSIEIILQSTADGSLQYWTIAGVRPPWTPAGTTPGLTQMATSPLVPGDAPGTTWMLRTVIPAASLPGAWLVFQDTGTGSLYYWELSGTTQASEGNVTFESGVNWTPTADWILGAAIDLNGDGTPDFVFQNSTDGSLQYAIQSGMVATSGGTIAGTTPGTLVGAGYFTGPGVPCLLFQDTETGALTYWTIVDLAQGTSGTFTPGSNPWFL